MRVPGKDLRTATRLARLTRAGMVGDINIHPADRRMRGDPVGGWSLAVVVTLLEVTLAVLTGSLPWPGSLNVPVLSPQGHLKCVTLRPYRTSQAPLKLQIHHRRRHRRRHRHRNRTAPHALCVVTCTSQFNLSQSAPAALVAAASMVRAAATPIRRKTRSQAALPDASPLTEPLPYLPVRHARSRRSPLVVLAPTSRSRSASASISAPISASAASAALPPPHPPHPPQAPTQPQSARTPTDSSSDSESDSAPSGTEKRPRAADDDSTAAEQEHHQAKRRSEVSICLSSGSCRGNTNTNISINTDTNTPRFTGKRAQLDTPGHEQLAAGGGRALKRRSEAGFFSQANTRLQPPQIPHYDSPAAPASYASPSSSTPNPTPTPTPTVASAPAFASTPAPAAASTPAINSERSLTERHGITPSTPHNVSPATLDGDSSALCLPIPTPAIASTPAIATYIGSDRTDAELGPVERSSRPTSLPHDDTPAALDACYASASSSTPTPAPVASPSTPVAFTPVQPNTAALGSTSKPPGKYFDKIVQTPSSPVIRSWEIPEAPVVEAEKSEDDAEDENLDLGASRDLLVTPAASPKPDTLPCATVIEQAARRASLTPQSTPEQPILLQRPATLRKIIGDVARMFTPRLPFGFSRKASSAVVEESPSPTRADKSSALGFMALHSPAVAQQRPSPSRLGGSKAPGPTALHSPAAVEQRPSPPEPDWGLLYRSSSAVDEQHPSPTKFDRNKAMELKALHFGSSKKTRGHMMTPYSKKSRYCHPSDDEDDMDDEERESCKLQFRKEIQLRRERLKMAKEKKNQIARKKSTVVRAKGKDQSRKKLDPLPAPAKMVAMVNDAVAQDTSIPTASAPPPDAAVTQTKEKMCQDPNIHTSPPTTGATAPVKGVAAGGSLAPIAPASPPGCGTATIPVLARQIRGTPAEDHRAAVDFARKTVGELSARYPGTIPQEKTWGQRVAALNDEEFALFHEMGRPMGEFQYTMFEYHLQKMKEDRLQKTRGKLRSQREEAAEYDDLFHKKMGKSQPAEDAKKVEEAKEANETRRAAREARRAKKAMEPKKEVFRPPPGTYGIFYEGWPEDDGYSDSDDSSSEDSDGRSGARGLSIAEAEQARKADEAKKVEEAKKAAKEARKIAREARRAKKAMEPKKEVFRPPPGTYGIFYEGWPEDDGYSDSDDSSSEDSDEAAEPAKERVRVEEERVRAEEERVRINQERYRAEEERVVRINQERVRAEQERVRINQERARAEQERVWVAPPSPRKRGDVSPIKPSRLRMVQNMSPIVMSPLEPFSLNNLQPRFRRISEAHPELIEDQKLGFVDGDVAMARRFHGKQIYAWVGDGLLATRYEEPGSVGSPGLERYQPERHQSGWEERGGTKPMERARRDSQRRNEAKNRWRHRTTADVKERSTISPVLILLFIPHSSSIYGFITLEPSVAYSVSAPSLSPGKNASKRRAIRMPPDSSTPRKVMRVQSTGHP
ncbi:unnamed protein product [Diplocarpon coronariae]